VENFDERQWGLSASAVTVELQRHRAFSRMIEVALTTDQLPPWELPRLLGHHLYRPIHVAKLRLIGVKRSHPTGHQSSTAGTECEKNLSADVRSLHIHTEHIGSSIRDW
jgi:hypothetical protein